MNRMKINAADILRPDIQSRLPKEETKQNIFNKEISFSFSKNKDQLKYRFFSEVSVLIGSGVDLKKSLEIIINGVSKTREKEILQVVLNKIVNGDSFSEALQSSNIFNRYDFYSVKIGEEAGTLITVLHELSTFYDKRISQQHQIRGALTYPALVLFTTIIALTFMLNFIVPMFKDVFLRFKGNLPPITQFVINLSEKFSHYIIILLVLMAIIIAFIILNRKKEWYRKYSSIILLKIPIVGSVMKLTYKARFCQTMRLLISSRVHLLDAIGLIEQMIDFFPMESALNKIKSSLSKGTSLSESMNEFSIFDKKMIALTKVAEEVNKMDIIYDQLFKQYSEELEAKVKSMNSLLEPVLIIFVGSIVALILISMYMPIFQIGTSIS